MHTGSQPTSAAGWIEQALDLNERRRSDLYGGTVPAGCFVGTLAYSRDRSGLKGRLPWLRPISTGNRLLDARSDRDRERTAPGLHILRLRRRELTHERGDRLRHVDFSIDTVLSIVATFLRQQMRADGSFARIVRRNLSARLDASEQFMACNHRGTVTVLGEALLEQAACECYATSTIAFAKSLRGGDDLPAEELPTGE